MQALRNGEIQGVSIPPHLEAAAAATAAGGEQGAGNVARKAVKREGTPLEAGGRSASKRGRVRTFFNVTPGNLRQNKAYQFTVLRSL